MAIWYYLSSKQTCGYWSTNMVTLWVIYITNDDLVGLKEFFSSNQQEMGYFFFGNHRCQCKVNGRSGRWSHELMGHGGHVQCIWCEEKLPARPKLLMLMRSKWSKQLFVYARACLVSSSYKLLSRSDLWICLICKQTCLTRVSFNAVKLYVRLCKRIQHYFQLQKNYMSI